MRHTNDSNAKPFRATPVTRVFMTLFCVATPMQLLHMWGVVLSRPPERLAGPAEQQANCFWAAFAVWCLFDLWVLLEVGVRGKPWLWGTGGQIARGPTRLSAAGRFVGFAAHIAGWAILLDWLAGWYKF
jgi:hypothetical protein